MIRAIGVSALVFIGAGIIYYRSFSAVPFTTGVLLTSAMNVLKVFMLERAVGKAVGMGDADAGKSYIKGQYFLRYIFTAMILVVAAVVPDTIISIWGAAAGVFTFQTAAIAIKVLKLDADMEDAPKAEGAEPKDNEDKLGEGAPECQ